MLSKFFSLLIRRIRPGFQLDPEVDHAVIFELVRRQFYAWLRGVYRMRSLAVRGLFLGNDVKFFNRSNMRFGKWVRLEDHVYVSALGKRPVIFGDHVRIGAFSRVVLSTTLNDLGSHITIGRNVGIGEFSYLGGAGGLEIGDDCIVGQYFSCHPENHVFSEPDILIRQQGVTRKGIRIGKDCWIGSRVTVLDGVEIGDHCVIAAGAVVHQSMPSRCVIGGVPARVLKYLPAVEPGSTGLRSNRETSNQIKRNEPAHVC